MNGLVLEYRDPFFSVFMFIFLIFLISFFTYTFGIYKEKKSRKEYRKLLERFELGDLKEDDYVHLYTTYNLPFDSIILLASTFLHKGEYNKAISVYLALLEHVNDKVKKEELLELLGQTYYRSGFLQRSKEIFLKILKFSPRNKKILQYLLLVYEKLKEYDRAQEVLVSLSELDMDTTKEVVYMQTLQILNDPLISFEKKSNTLIDIFKENKQVERLVANYLLQFNKTLFWENIQYFNILELFDYLWYLNFDDIDFDIVSKNSLLKELYTAKGYIKEAANSQIFELDTMIVLKDSKTNFKTDLSFKFLCSSCKTIQPIYVSRCPKCNGILNFNIELELTRKKLETNQSLQ